jgi:hypothetical protein
MGRLGRAEATTRALVADFAAFFPETLAAIQHHPSKWREIYLNASAGQDGVAGLR